MARPEDDRDRMNLTAIDTTASIAPGDSGGPLLNEQGQLVGLTFGTPNNASAARFGWHVDFAPGAPTVRFPRIDTTRLAVEFGAALSNLSADLATLAADGQEVQCSPSMSEAVG